jgi:hypothetical protein
MQPPQQHSHHHADGGMRPAAHAYGNTARVATPPTHEDVAWSAAGCVGTSDGTVALPCRSAEMEGRCVPVPVQGAVYWLCVFQVHDSASALALEKACPLQQQRKECMPTPNGL